MKILGLKTLRHSILAQMTLMSLLFLGTFTYFMIAKPIFEAIAEQQTHSQRSTSIDSTAREFIRGLNSQLYLLADKDDLTAVLDDDYLQKVLRKNPELKFTIRNDHLLFSNKGATPRLTSFFDAEHFAVKNQFQTAKGCKRINFESSFQVNLTKSYFHGHYCENSIVTIEISNLTTPVKGSLFTRQGYIPKWLWDSSREVIYATTGLFALMIAILAFNLITIRRVANVASVIDISSLNTTLPEKGLPVEVLPLVHAVNEMIEKVRKTTEKHDFFLSTAAHEMRTPLTVLRTRLALLEDGPNKKLLETDIKRIIDLVNQLLRLMRTLEPKELVEHVDLVQCCRSVVNNMQPLYKAQNVQLYIHSEPKQFYRLADENLFKVAISNLLDNALSFSRPGDSVTISINHQQQIIISDQGKGIDPTRIDNIFTAFAKFPPNRKDHHGLGLAIVQAIVNIHNGKISVNNRKTGGAEFVIQFDA